MLLILDDLHWSAAPAIALLRHIVRRRCRAAAGAGHVSRKRWCRARIRLGALITQLQRERTAEQISLSGMTEPQVADFIEAWSGQHASPLLATTMQGRTEGNRYSSRRAAAPGGHWRTVRSRSPSSRARDELTLLPTIRAVVELQLDGLSENCRRLLTNAAVLGSDFEIDAVRRMLDDVAVADALAEALARGSSGRSCVGGGIASRTP